MGRIASEEGHIVASFGVRCLGRALRFVAVAIHVQPQVCPVVRIFELVVVATLIEGGVAVVDDGRVKRTIARVGIVEERARQAVIVGDLPGSLEEGQILVRSEEHTSELQSLMRISYAVFCLKKQKTTTNSVYNINNTQSELATPSPTIHVPLYTIQIP